MLSAWPLKLHNWRLYLQLIRFDKPIGTLLLLYPTLCALVIANQGLPSLKNTIIFCLGTFLMRSAGCAINDFADREFDGHVNRTQTRPLAQGLIQPAEAVALAALLALLAFILVLFTNLQTILLSFVGAALAAIYPFTKRYTHLPQLVLGAAFAWAIPLAYSASNAVIDATAWLLFAATILWTLSYDTVYAMIDRDDDLKIGVKSTAILFAKYDKTIVALIQIIVIILFALAGHRLEFTLPYYCALMLALGLFISQQRMIRRENSADYFKAFLNNQWVGVVLFAGVLGHYSTL